jgi:hypothetical protein
MLGNDPIEVSRHGSELQFSLAPLHPEHRDLTLSHGLLETQCFATVWRTSSRVTVKAHSRLREKLSDLWTSTLALPCEAT